MHWRSLLSTQNIELRLQGKAKPAADTLAPYFRPGFFARHKYLSGLALALIAALYGLVFGVTATVFLIQMMIPVALVTVLVVALLPESGVVFSRTVTWLFFAFFFALAVWPDYLALSFGNLPWITAVRLIAIPLCLLFLVSLSQSSDFRASLATRLNSTPLVWKFMLAYFVISFVSIGISDKPAESVNKFIIAIYAWGTMYLAGVQVFAQVGRARQFAQTLWVGVLITCFVGLWEFRIDRIPWAGHIPSFLKIEDEFIARVLAGGMRAAIGEHRVQAKFTTPLGLAEFLALMTPFILHFIARGRSWLERGAAALTMPLILFVIDKTDSRLGFIGFLLSIFGYGFFLSLRHWQTRRDSAFAPVIVAGYPAMMVTLLVASFVFTRLKNMVWGSGAYQASNEGRANQIAQGLDLVIRQPWGHGIGRAAETLGYTNGAGVVTIDTYYLSIALEAGVLGFIAYYGAFLAVMLSGVKLIVAAGEDEDTSWLLPALLSLSVFFIIKSVFSQQENHPIAFALLGMAAVLIHRVKTGANGMSKLHASQRT